VGGWRERGGGPWVGGCFEGDKIGGVETGRGVRGMGGGGGERRWRGVIWYVRGGRGVLKEGRGRGRKRNVVRGVIEGGGRGEWRIK